MTNTLHRYGTPESLKDDYIVFIIQSMGINDQGAEVKIKRFAEASLEYKPVNMGHSSTGTLYEPEKDQSFFKLYFRGREEKRSPKEFVLSLENPQGVDMVFDNKAAMQGFLKDVKALDLGLSVNVSALIEDIREVCKQNEIILHSVEYSLGFHGDVDRLPERDVLKVTTMCGHGMISAAFAQKMISHIKEGRVTPEKAAGYLAKFCVCGVFNTSRAIRIFNEIRKGG